jgi:phosphoglycolate phosphatase
MTAIKNIDSIIFDFDYTLVDSSPAIIECISYALGKIGLPVPTTELIRKTIGMSSKDALRTLLQNDNPNVLKEFRYYFTHMEDEITLEKTILLDGVREALVELDSRNFQLGIVSNASSQRIGAFLSSVKLNELIDVVIGFEEAPKLKPDPSGLLMAIKKLGRSREQTAYIGDSLVDAETAHRTRMPFIAVLTGVNDKQEFKKYAPVIIINNLQELLPWLIK